MKIIFISLVGVLGLMGSAHAEKEVIWTCEASYDCGEGGISYRDYFGQGVSTNESAAVAAAKNDAEIQCNNECSSFAKPPYDHPTCSWGMNPSCTSN